MNRLPLAFSLLLYVAASLLTSSASAQVQTGTPAFGSYGGGPDVINLANLNVHLTIPVLHKPGRGTPFSYDLSYDSSIWYPVGVSGSQSWQSMANFGWHAATEVSVGYISYSGSLHHCTDDGNRNLQDPYMVYSGWAYHDPYGITHNFGGIVKDGNDGNCINPSPYPETQTILATDGSGFKINMDGTVPTANVVAKTGEVINPPLQAGSGSGTFVDRNGNKITVDASGHFYDTLSATAPVLTVAGTAPANTTFTYTVPSGGSATYTVKYTIYPIRTNFGCSNVPTEYGTNGTTTANLVSEIDLPDWNATTNPNSKYIFTYESTPGYSSFVTGRLASVTLPTGGAISYTYIGGNNGITCADGSTSGLKRYTPDTATNYWEYDRTAGTGAAYTTIVTDPAGNQTRFQFQGIYETERQAYQGSTSGALLSTVDTCYNGAATPCTGTAVTLPVNARSVQSAVPSAGNITLVSKTVTTYNSVGVPTEVDQYAFGSGSAPNTPTRKTLITYASLGNITAFQQQVQVTNGSGTLLAQTTNNYDETTPTNAPANTPQLVSVTGSRGNLTSVQRCFNLGTCSTSPKSIMTYDTAGQVLTAKDPRNNQTTFSYADSFLDDDGSNPPSHAHAALGYPTDAYVTSISPPLNGAISMKYYFYIGKLALTTDQNSNNSFNHFDQFGRPTTSYGPQVPYPGGTARPWSLLSYTSSTQFDSYLGIDDPTAATNCGACRQDEVLLDGLGRSVTQKLVSDPEGATSVGTTYDVRGLVNTVSHAQRSTSSTTDGVETPSYDAMGRTIKITHPDTTFSQTFYGPAVAGAGGVTAQNCASGTYGYAFPTLAVDESGRKREIWTDGLGRTIEGDEPDGTGALSSYICYAYDPLGNLLQVSRSGTPSQTRTYAYDPLSRVTSVTIPERANSGGTNCAVTFTYDSNSNLQTRVAPSPNQNASCTTTVTTTYYYDALDRLTKKTYSDTTPTVQYGYDGIALTGCTTTPPALTDSNPKGRMTSMCDASGASSWAHDATGKILTEKRTILGVTETISYSYNLDGSSAAITYPSTKTVTYTVSNAQRLLTAKDNASGTQFVLMASYAPTGALQSTVTGQISGGFGGVTESRTYNNSLEHTGTTATSSAGTAMNLTMAYTINGGDNGSVTTITNNADSGRTQTLTYDPLNRILKAVSQATSGADCWGQTFGADGNASDDPLANLLKMNTGIQTMPPCTLGSLDVTVDANNHINKDATFAYDAVGNMTKDGGSLTYSFDVENRLYKASGMTGGPYCYVYDGNGLRVAKKSGAASDCSGGTVSKLYWRSIAGDALAETDGSGSVTNSAYNEYVFFTGRRVTSRSGTGAIFYFFADHLGTTRTITTGNGPGQTPGQLCYDADFTPYGQEIQHTERLQTAACPPSYKFTGYERDSETTEGANDTGLDYAFARYYSSRLGRFLSTDPLGGSLGSLQSHNAYAYTQNNPLNSVDSLGLWCTGDPGGGDCSSPSGGGGGIGFFDMLNFGIQAQIGTLYEFTSNSAYFHFSDYGLDDLLNFVNTGELTGVTMTPVYGFPLFVFGEPGGGPGGRAGTFARRFYTNPVHQVLLNNCIVDVFGVHAPDLPIQSVDNAPAVDGSKTASEIAGMCNYHGGAPLGCNSPDPSPNGTIFLTKEKFNDSSPSTVALNNNTFVHELGNLLDHSLFPNTPVGSPFYESHFGGAALNLNDSDTGANLADCFEKALKAAGIQ